MKTEAIRLIIKRGLGTLACMMALFGSAIYAGPIDKPVYQFHDDYCFAVGDITVCYANDGIILGVNTPGGGNNSGNTAYLGKGTNSYMEIDASGKATYSDTFKYFTQGVNIDSVAREFSQWFSKTLSVNGYNCITTYAFRMVNGKIVVDRSTSCY